MFNRSREQTALAITISIKRSYLTGFGLFPFRSPLLWVSRESHSIHTNIRVNGMQLFLFSFPPGTEMFHFPGFASVSVTLQILRQRRRGFPHSEISGSQATNRLPEAYRRLVASFLAVLGQGIHRALLCLSYGDLHSTFIQH